MTDKKNVGGQLTADDTKETWSRVSKLSHKLKANKHARRRKQSQSPLSGTSIYYRKDSETPKRLSRIRFNGCNSGDSPSEAEPLQEIIWDPASPPLLWNGKGVGESVRGVEISDIVNRIAPNDEKPVDKDLVLQWIGDSAIPCTPELQQPRVRRSSARRQSNNVEDLMKLAKQFDMNMTRQDKERDLEIQQATEASEDLDKLHKPIAHNSYSQGKGPSIGAQTPVPGKTKGLSHEEELHALFDGPTQHLSGRLSPPSANCSQESSVAPAGLSAKRPDSADSTSMPKHPADVSRPDFEDDWENDDLLDDSFVLEINQNPEVLASSAERRIVGAGSAASRECEPATITSSLGPCSRAGCLPQLPSGGNSSDTYTGTFSKAQCPDPSNPRPGPNTSVQTAPVQRLSKPSPDPAKTSRPQAQSPCSRKQATMTVNNGEKTRKTEGSGSSSTKDSHRLAGASEKDPELDSGVLWGDGDYDDDLLYQACDDVERISASQEQEEGGTCTDLISSKSTMSSSKASLSINTTHFSSVGTNSRTAHPSQATEHQQPMRIFARSHSIPGATSARENKQDLAGGTRVNCGSHCGEPGRYRFTPVKHASGVTYSAQQTTGTRREARSHGPSTENTTSHHSTFKRHQSDPVTQSNKVFVTVQPAVRCSAAEIEKKKQEAIARRRSRLQATEKPGTAP